MMKNASAYRVERRSGRDRRAKRFGNIRWFLKTGQRRKVRRESDRRKIICLDYYPAELFTVIVIILALSVIDGILTLWLIDKGAMEVNPVMAFYLNLGPDIFMAIKYLVTAAAVTIVVVMNHAFIRILRVRFGQLLKVFAGCFAVVVVWELYLMAQLVM